MKDVLDWSAAKSAAGIARETKPLCSNSQHESLILARFYKLRDQGRRPELTLSDAMQTANCDEFEARAALNGLRKLRKVICSVKRPVAIWALVGYVR